MKAARSHPLMLHLGRNPTTTTTTTQPSHQWSSLSTYSELFTTTRNGKIFSISDYVLRGQKKTKNEMLDDVKGRRDILNDCDSVSAGCTGSKALMVQTSNLTRDVAHNFGFVSYLRREILTKYLSTVRNTVMKGMGENNVLEGDLNYVETNRSNPVDIFRSNDRQQDKEYAIVVAGESGAGKTCFSYLVAEEAEYNILYKSLSVKKNSAETKETRKRTHTQMNEQLATSKSRQTLEDVLGERDSEEYPDLNEFLRNFVCLWEANGNPETLTKNTNLELLYTIKTKLNRNRDAWAKKILDLCIKEALCDKDHKKEFDRWLNGLWEKTDRPKNLAIIIDEVVDTDLAEGLVSTVRETTATYSRLVQDHVRLVIVGTGLDQIRYGDRVGTNPALSRLIVVQKPDIRKICGGKANLTELECNAILQGGFSQFLCSNSRMLFRSLIPIMKIKFHHQDANGLDEADRSHRLQERLKDVGSTRCLMDHAPRYYVNQNSVGNLKSRSRDNLLAFAFFHHQKNEMDKILHLNNTSKRHSQNAVEFEHDQLIRNMEKAQQPVLEGDDTIFNRGLVCLSGTSSA